jgi:hypothetical protein
MPFSSESVGPAVLYGKTIDKDRVSKNMKEIHSVAVALPPGNRHSINFLALCIWFFTIPFSSGKSQENLSALNWIR